MDMRLAWMSRAWIQGAELGTGSTPEMGRSMMLAGAVLIVTMIVILAVAYIWHTRSEREQGMVPTGVDVSEAEVAAADPGRATVLLPAHDEAGDEGGGGG